MVKLTAALRQTQSSAPICLTMEILTHIRIAMIKSARLIHDTQDPRIIGPRSAVRFCVWSMVRCLDGEVMFEVRIKNRWTRSVADFLGPRPRVKCSHSDKGVWWWRRGRQTIVEEEAPPCGYEVCAEASCFRQGFHQRSRSAFMTW